METIAIKASQIKILLLLLCALAIVAFGIYLLANAESWADPSSGSKIRKFPQVIRLFGCYLILVCSVVAIIAIRDLFFRHPLLVLTDHSLSFTNWTGVTSAKWEDIFGIHAQGTTRLGFKYFELDIRDSGNYIVRKRTWLISQLAIIDRFHTHNALIRFETFKFEKSHSEIEELLHKYWAERKPLSGHGAS